MSSSVSNDGPLNAPKRAAWSVKVSGGRVPLAYTITSEPALAGDLLIVGFVDERIAAFDSRTGTESWSAPAACPGAPRPAVSGTAVFASLDGQPPSIVSFDLATGARRWTRELELGPPFGVLRPVAVTDGRVLAVNGKTVLALDADSGTVVWRVAIAEAAWPVGIAAEDGAVVVTVADGSERGRNTIGLDPTTGAERWRFAGEGRLAPSIAGSDAFCAGPGGTLAVLDAATGAERWRGPATLDPWSEPAIASDLVLVPRRISPFAAAEPATEIHALDRATGACKWTHLAPGDAHDPHVVLGRTTAYATGAKLRAFERASGALLWEWAPPAKARMEGRPTLADGMLFVPTDKGLFALR